jgi:hypothetical protein
VSAWSEHGALSKLGQFARRSSRANIQALDAETATAFAKVALQWLSVWTMSEAGLFETDEALETVRIDR